MSKAKSNKQKQRFDLWILASTVVRIAEANITAKQCRKIASETELNKGELFLMTPVSSEAYCPLLSHNQA